MATALEEPPPPTLTEPVTLEQFADMEDPPDAVLELDKGEVVEVTRSKHRHGRICSKIDRTIGRWLDEGRGGELATNDAGIITDRDADSLRGPDVYYFAPDRVPSDEEELEWLENPPDLCVEVRSPSETWPGVIKKAQEYLAAGSREVWVCDPDRRQVQVYTRDAGPRIVGAEETLTSPVLPGFSVVVDELFARGRRVD